MSNLPHFCVISIPVLEAERVFSPVLIQLLISYIDICHLMYQVYRNILHFSYHIYNLHYHPHHIHILSHHHIVEEASIHHHCCWPS